LLLHGFYDVVALDDFAEDDVSTIQPASDGGGYEELRAVGVFSGVSHRQLSGLGMLELEVLIGEFLSVDRLATSAVALGEVPALAHELRNYTMETGSLVSVTILVGAELAEVTSGLGDNVVVKLKDDAASILATDLDIKINVPSIIVSTVFSPQCEHTKQEQ